MTLSVLGSHTAVGYMARPAEMLGASGPHVAPADVLAVEQSAEYRGHYFVLMGELSPLDGVGPRELGLDVLEARLNEGQIQELILATGTTVEGEATAHYVLDLAREAGVSVTRIAQGVPMGGDLEFVDGATLAQALRGRRPFSS